MKNVMILGNIGSPAQTRTTAEGKQFTTFSVAVTKRDKTAMWFSVVGRTSEALLPYLTKGRQVFVIGDLEASIFNGNIDLSIFADKIELCGKGNEDEPKPATPTPQTTHGESEVEAEDNGLTF